MATASIYTWDNEGMVTHELEVGQVYRARAGGYGIIVIEDTMHPVKDKPLDTFPNNDLVILLNSDNQKEVAPSRRDPIGATSAFRGELSLRPVVMNNQGIYIIVGVPL